MPAFGSDIVDSLYLGQSKIMRNIALGYENDALVGHYLFPIVNTKNQRIIVPEYSAEHMKRRQTKRALRAKTLRVKEGTVTPHSIELDEQALDLLIDHREIDAQNEAEGVLDLVNMNVETLSDILLLEGECRIADFAQDLNNFPTNHKVEPVGTDLWTHADSNPLIQIRTGITQGRSVGIKYNTLLFGVSAWRSFESNAKVVAEIHGTVSGKTMVTIEDVKLKLASMGISNVVIGADQLANESAGVFNDIWADNCILAKTPKNPKDQSSTRSMAAGYSFRYNGKTKPIVTTYWEDQTKKNLVVDVQMMMSEYLLKNTAWYIIATVNS